MSSGLDVSMIKSELIAKVAEAHPELTSEQAERAVKTILEAVSSTLEEGGRVELRGFGAFSVRTREARVGRNPRTGEQVAVPQKSVPFFRAGKELRERVDSSRSQETSRAQRS